MAKHEKTCKGKNALVICQDSVVNSVLSYGVQKTTGCNILHAHSMHDAVRCINTKQVDLIICDELLGGKETGGRELVDFLNTHHSHIPIILTGGETAENSYNGVLRFSRQCLHDLPRSYKTLKLVVIDMLNGKEITPERFEAAESILARVDIPKETKPEPGKFTTRENNRQADSSPHPER